MNKKLVIRKVQTYLLVGLSLMFCAAALLFQPMMEARTFNKFTEGPKASIIDAIFGTLRVTD